MTERYYLTRHPKVSDEAHLEMLARWAASEAEAWIATPTSDKDKTTHRYRTLLLRWAIGQIADEPDYPREEGDDDATI